MSCDDTRLAVVARVVEKGDKRPDSEPPVFDLGFPASPGAPKDVVVVNPMELHGGEYVQDGGSGGFQRVCQQQRGE